MIIQLRQVWQVEQLPRLLLLVDSLFQYAHILVIDNAAPCLAPVRDLLLPRNRARTASVRPPIPLRWRIRIVHAGTSLVPGITLSARNLLHPRCGLLGLAGAAISLRSAFVRLLDTNHGLYSVLFVWHLLVGAHLQKCVVPFLDNSLNCRKVLLEYVERRIAALFFTEDCAAIELWLGHSWRGAFFKIHNVLNEMLFFKHQAYAAMEIFLDRILLFGLPQPLACRMKCVNYYQAKLFVYKKKVCMCVCGGGGGGGGRMYYCLLTDRRRNSQTEPRLSQQKQKNVKNLVNLRYQCSLKNWTNHECDLRNNAKANWFFPYFIVTK